MVTGQIEPAIKYEVILGLQSREKAALLKVKIIYIFSQRIYMKIEFSSERRENNGFVLLDHQHGRRDVTMCIKCVEVLHDASYY